MIIQKSEQSTILQSCEALLEQFEPLCEIYRKHYFCCDFINRCIDRRLEETGLCNLPYSTLADEGELLSLAYNLYVKKEDCNTAYNVTLDLIVNDIESLIASEQLTPVVSTFISEGKEMLTEVKY